VELEEVVVAVAVAAVAVVVVVAVVAVCSGGAVVVVHVDVLDVSSGDGDTASALLRGVVDIHIVLEVLGKVPVRGNNIGEHHTKCASGCDGRAGREFVRLK
jgi:hypothetical protein